MAKANSDSQSAIMTLTQEDLKDPSGASAKLNNVIQFLASRLAGAEIQLKTIAADQKALAASQASGSGGVTAAVTPPSPSLSPTSAFSNSAASAGASTLGSRGSPTVSVALVDIPVVLALPGPADPLSVIGQHVLYAGQPYIFTAGLSGPPGYWALDVTFSPTIQDTAANLSLYPAANYPVGTVFRATDWNTSWAVQSIAGVHTWIYYNGIYGAPLANIPTTLGVTEKGFLFQATDYFHNWMWDGSAWHFTTGGFAAGSFYVFSSPSMLPADALWQVCDGSTVQVAQDNGTTAPVTTPVQANTYMVR